MADDDKTTIQPQDHATFLCELDDIEPNAELVALIKLSGPLK